MRSLWTTYVPAVVLALGMGAVGGQAQTILEDGPQSTEDALHAMARQAGIIFAGQVIAVRRHGGADGATGVVEVEFAVDDAVRGVSSSLYTLREWAGLWAAGDQPLRAGQRYLMLLHAPSAAGLSSPVGGTDGAIPISGDGQSSTPTAEPLTHTLHLAGSVALADTRTVDLRWIAARVRRPVSYTAEPVHPTALPIGMRAHAFGAMTVLEPESAFRSPGSNLVAASPADAVVVPAARDADYATVMALLRNWETSDHGAR